MTTTRSTLDGLAWTDPRVPDDISVCIGPADPTGLLLAMVSRELDVPMSDIDLHPPRWDPGFRFDRRPPLATAAGRRVFTSISRTPGCVVVAVSRRRIGVDIERLQTQRQSTDLLSLLHPCDRLGASDLSGDTRRAAATMLWTRVESALKLRGTGLRVDPATVPVGLGPQPAAFSRFRTLSTACDRQGRPVSCTGEATSGRPLAAEYSVSLSWDRWESLSRRP